MMQIVFMAIFLRSVLGFSSGPPLAVCQSMTPNPSAHGAQPQAGVSPFTIVTDKSYYRPGETVRVTIQSSGAADRFKGILVQAREVGNNGAIGTFSDRLPTGLKHLACSNAKGAVAHSQSGNWRRITLEWKPPSDVSRFGNIFFVATVVKERTIFWVKLRSLPLSNR